MGQSGQLAPATLAQDPQALGEGSGADEARGEQRSRAGKISPGTAALSAVELLYDDAVKGLTCAGAVESSLEGGAGAL